MSVFAASLVLSSADNSSRKEDVPDLAIVPRVSASSALSNPIPVSVISIVFFFLSISIRMLSSDVFKTPGSV